MPEGRRIFPQMTVLENLEIGAYHKPHGQNAKLDQVYELFPILQERRKQQGGTCRVESSGCRYRPCPHG